MRGYFAGKEHSKYVSLKDINLGFLHNHALVKSILTSGHSNNKASSIFSDLEHFGF